MAVSVETVSGLERRMTVDVAAMKIENEVSGRLLQLAKDVRIDGFRRGKVPLKVVETRYLGQVREEVIKKELNASLQTAFQQEKLRPVMESARVEITHNQRGSDLQYIATFEVYPEIVLGDITALLVQAPKVTITDTDIDNEIERQRQALATWQDVMRPIQQKDRVQISFCSAVEPDTFADSEWVKDFWLEIGSGQMQPGFEDGLIGASVGDKRELILDPPANIDSEELRDKKVHFLVEIHQITASQLPAVDEDFCQRLQIEQGVAGLRDALRQRLEQYVATASERWQKSQLLEALLARHEFEVPKTLVDAEIKRRARGLLERMGVNSNENEELPDLMRQVFEASAKRSVLLGLLLGEVIQQYKLEPNKARVLTALTELAARYYTEPSVEVINQLQQNREVMASITYSVLESQATDKLQETAIITPTSMSYDDLMAALKATPTF